MVPKILLLKLRIERAQTTVGCLPRLPAQSLTKLCQRENAASSHTSVVCCLTISTHEKPTVHAGCIRQNPKSTDRGPLALQHPKLTPLPAWPSWHALRPRLLYTLQHRWTANHPQQTFPAQHRQSKPTAPPWAMQEWKAHCRTETPPCGTPNSPNLHRSCPPRSYNFANPHLIRE